MLKKPIIAIPLDWEDTPSYSVYPWYALRTNYASVMSDNNAIPILLPYDINSIPAYIAMMDGLMITGGDYDLDPSVYGEEKTKDTRNIRTNRTDFETALIKEALARNIPILAICAGEQLLAALYGGKLLQDIKVANPNALQHEQKYLNIPMAQTSHNISVNRETLLHKIVQKDSIAVNSSHHQAVKSVGSEMIVSGVAEDGVIEAVEMPGYNFVLGVEWHPEYLATKEDELIIKSFIEAAKK
jgi:putative glutamine amidotransferase